MTTEQKMKQNQTSPHSDGLRMETLVTDRQHSVSNSKVKTLQKKGTSRQSGGILHLTVSLLPFLEFDRAAFSGSEHFIRDPLYKCMNSTLSGSTSDSCKQYEIIAIIMQLKVISANDTAKWTEIPAWIGLLIYLEGKLIILGLKESFNISAADFRMGLCPKKVEG